MTQQREYDSLDEALLGVLRLIDLEGDEAAPRGMRTKEALNVCFKLTNPRARLVWNQARRWSFPLAVGEFLWHLSGSNDASAISHYAPRWAEFSDGKVISSSCYGFKIFQPTNGGLSQWNVVTNLLKTDPSTRRAMINLYEPTENTLPDAVDVACASTLQFFLRDDRLHLTVYMRSNDAVWGLPYDCFVFTMLQELLACELGVPIGDYVHFAASLHVYERHYSLVERMLDMPDSGNSRPMSSMPPETRKDLLILSEEQIRTDGPILDFERLGSYWQDLLLVLSWHKAYRLEDSEMQQRAKDCISEPAYRDLLTNWVTPMTLAGSN